MPCSQFLESIDRERRPLPLQLDLGDREALVAGHGPPAQLEPWSRPGSGSTGLCGGMPGGDQHHAVEPELHDSLLRAHEVTKMWRVEGPA